MRSRWGDKAFFVPGVQMGTLKTCPARWQGQGGEEVPSPRTLGQSRTRPVPAPGALGGLGEEAEAGDSGHRPQTQELGHGLRSEALALAADDPGGVGTLPARTAPSSWTRRGWPSLLPGVHGE